VELGAFSISLAVKDLSASKAFYETLGFSSLGGNPDHGYLILKNGETVIGLFQGMFEQNILTFNPGWDSSAQNVDPFTDVRALHARLKEAGVAFQQENNLDGEGPASFVLNDPDGNPILVDQHR